MQPFDQSEEYTKIKECFEDINRPTVRINSYQQTMVDTILNSQHFQPICQTITAIQSYQGQLLSNADLSLIQLKTQQIQQDKQNRQKYVDKLNKAVQKMLNSIGMVDDCHSIAISKLQWIQSQTEKIQQERQQIEQEIQIMSCQNNKPQTKKLSEKESKDLHQLLKQYECPNGFFRNKTEILMHINRIEARIQHLQMKKLKTYAMSQQ